ncbi:MAG: C1 family peptidase [Bacteroidota bacterium]
MKSRLILFLLAAAYTCSAQLPKEGQLSPEQLTQIRASVKAEKNLTPVVNAATENELKKLAQNRSNAGKTDHFFSNEVKTSGITDQKSSGRCWLFTGLNTIKPKVLEKYNLADFEFSMNYNFFYDQFEKANLFLEAIIYTASKSMDDRYVDWLFKNPIGDGGQWANFADVVSKYGVVPKNAMPESFQSESTGSLNKMLSAKLREDGLQLRDLFTKKEKPEALRAKKLDMLKDIYKMLVVMLGEPPTEFEWRYKDKSGKITEPMKYTPQQFYAEACGVNFTDYVMLMNDPTREYYKLYEIEWDRNTVEGTNWLYVNLPIEDVREFAKQSILGNEALYFSCDVGKQLDIEEGTLDVNNYDYGSLFGVTFGMDKKQRIMTYESGSSHGMALVGVDLAPDKSIRKWKLENSWGATKGNKGYLTMTDAWFAEYMFRLVINKKYLNAKVLDVLKQKPTLLPPWDPMYKMDE